MKSSPFLFLLSLLVAAALQSCKAAPPSASSGSTATSSGISEKVKGMQKYSGYFDFYYDEKKDKVWLLVDRLDEEFLYVNSLSAGIGSNDIGLDRGQLGSSRVVFFLKAGSRLLLKQPNYDYRAESDNPDEVKAVQDAFATSILFSFEIAASEEGKHLIDISPMLMNDVHGVADRLKRSNQGTYRLNKDKSFVYLPRTKNFPLNSEFEAELTFDGDPSGWYIRSVTPSAEHVTVRQHHSFIELPDSNYTPRKFDPRAGYFGTGYYDYATPVTESLSKRFITRHRLEKKDPSAEKSEAVEPIIYYLDRGAPEPIRSALMEGASWWNQAFEAAGYTNAFQVKLLPEDADPMDVRYNVINWVHRSSRGWSYGSSVTDPRTGEIIKGHVTLGSLRVRQDFLIAEGLLAPYEDGETVPEEMLQMALARLRQLSAHEVGHTIGLAHSYTSSTEGRASVMDYPHPQAQIIDGEISLKEAYDDKIGAWDKYSITWGYSDFPEGADEDELLEEIIQESLKDGITFLSDQDARPTGSAHPYAHLWDNGENVAVELNKVMEVRALAMKNFGEKNIRKDVPYGYLDEVLAPIYFYHRYQTEAVAKLVGGLNYRYALRGDGQFITQFIEPSVQKEAMDALMLTLSPDHLTLPESVISKIPPRPLGYSRNPEVIKIRTGITFDPIAAAETAADLTTSLLLHPARAARLVEYHQRNSDQPGLEEVMEKLIGSTFKSARQQGLKAEIQRTVEQVTLENIMALGSSSNSSSQVKALCAYYLEELKSFMSTKASGSSIAWKAHYQYMIGKIEDFEEHPEKYEKLRPLSPPAGSPIGN